MIRTLHGHDQRRYEPEWKEWHKNFDRYRTRDGKHFLNGMSYVADEATEIECICHVAYFNAPLVDLIREFQKHLDANEPARIDVGALIKEGKA